MLFYLNISPCNGLMLVFASFPSMFFCYLPYSESLFFFFSTLFLCGYYKQNTSLIVIGLFLASLTRSVAPFFIAAISAVEFLGWSLKREDLNIHLKRALIYIGVVLSAILIVGLIQYIQTGKWFYFVEVQKYWGKQLQLPKIPFTTWDAPRILWLDGLSLLIGLMALILIIYFTFVHLTKRLSVNNDTSVLIFSIVYLICVATITVLTSVRDAATETTSIYSLNRYVLCVPFIFPLLKFLTTVSFKNFAKYLTFGILLLLILLLLNRQSTVNIAIVIFYLSVFFLFSFKTVFNKYWQIAYIMNIFLQFITLYWFIGGLWIG